MIGENESENEYRSGSEIKYLLEKKKFCAIAYESNEKYPKCQSKEELTCSIGRMMNPIIVAVRRHSSRKIATKVTDALVLVLVYFLDHPLDT
ncbi:hypothetical protein DdX_14128 [Ditylenchus destructor]|uniref:Uncharacterized protein n=1 Tax=Ditylenchus destructor TaxID=166010 RepID=A0AAD4MTB6_9BILA|nr:hypothetical protein DdX_14128 [Ditylenchus destructor]